MAFWGGAGAGGWSSGIGGQQGMRTGRGADGWDEEYLGKAYDAEVVRRIVPYLSQYKLQATIAFICMMTFAACQFLTPLLIGFTVEAGARGDEHQVFVYLGIMASLAVLGWASAFFQQLVPSGTMVQAIYRRSSSN